MYRAHDARARVRYRRRAGIADQRHRSPGCQQFDNARGRCLFVVVVRCHELRANSVRTQERGRGAGVLGGDHIDSRQHFQGPECDVAQISERRGDHI